MFKAEWVVVLSLLVAGGMALYSNEQPREAVGKVQYNGIVLPEIWPPSREPTQQRREPPYLQNRPAVIPIDLGRQLFVDDFLIETSTLHRTAHRPVLASASPVIEARTGLDSGFVAAPYSDGVWFDPAMGLFRAWYWGGGVNGLAYAHSQDGTTWIREKVKEPVLPAFPHMVINAGGGRDSGTTWIDYAADASERYKAFIYSGSRKQSVWFSRDGIHWNKQDFLIEAVSDRTTFFYNPFRRVWVESVRARVALPALGEHAQRVSRSRVYRESFDLRNWTPSDDNPTATFWVGPDEDDAPYPGTNSPPELYNLDAVAYESLLVGLFSWFYPEDGANLVEVNVGFSRDGFHWSRPSRGGAGNAFLPATNREGDWNAYNTQSVGGGFLVVGDELWFYFSGRNARHGTPLEDGAVSTGLAKLRRDGFYSMDADSREASLTTLPVIFSGSRLFVNIDDPNGELRVEVLDEEGRPLTGFSREDATPISTDSVQSLVRWGDNEDLGKLAGRAVRFRFHLRAGSLYSFWVSPDSSGVSRGYVAAGGPEFDGPSDGPVPPFEP